MLIENDFEHDDGHRQPDAPASPLPPPLVVIHYRDRGIPLLLVPPVLILAAVLGFQAHRRMAPPRPADAPPPGLAAEAGHDPRPPAESRPADAPLPGLAAEEGRPPENGSTGAEEEAGLFLARGESSATPALDPGWPLTPEPPAEPAPAPAPGPPDAAIAEEDRMPLPSEPEHVDEATTDMPGPADPPALGPDPFGGPVPSPPPPEPVLTKEQVLDRIRLEAERKAARLRDLDAWKPRLLERDRKLGEEIRAVQLVDIQRLAETKRIPFHAELRKLVVALGDRAGPRINSLCEEYGRVTMPEIFDAVQTRLRRTSTRLGRREKVEMMRRFGLPEPIILDAIARDAARSLNTRGGPRNMDEVRALAGRQLLAIPPTRGARATMKPVAEASLAPVPGAGRRPQ